MIVFVYPSANFGGHEVMALKIMQGIKKSPVLALYNKKNHRLEGEINKLSNANHYPICCHDSKFDLIAGQFNPRIIVALFKYINLLKNFTLAEVVVVNGNAVANHLETLALMYACRIRQIKLTMYLPMLHSAEELGLSPLKGFFFKLALWRSLNGVKNYIVISEVWRNRIHQIAKESDIGIIKNIVHSKNALRKTEVIKFSGKFNACFVGRLEIKHKGLDFLVDLVQRLKINGIFQLHIVGDGPDKKWLIDKLDQIKERKPEFTFFFHGWLENPIEVIRRCNSLLLTSRVEGLPLVALEALSVSIPVFGFNITGIDEIIPDEYLVKPFDIKLLCAKIEKFANDNVKEIQKKSDLSDFFDEDRFNSEVNSYFKK